MQIITGDALEGLRGLPSECCDMCVTSPPYYGLRDYGAEGQIGLEGSPEEYIGKLVEIFREVRRVLRQNGTLWVNVGDSYATRSGPQPPMNTRNKSGHTAKSVPPGFKQKDLMGIPWMLAFALRADGWYLRQDIIWHKPNCMPESVRDRCTKSHEYIFLFSKSPHYYTSEEQPRLEFSGCYNPSTEKVAVMCATMFPSLERGDCVKVPAMAQAPEGHEGPEEDRCPVCGAEIEYDGDQEIVDDGTVVGFTCPKCGAYGKAGYDLVFDDYYDVQEGPQNG